MALQAGLRYNRGRILLCSRGAETSLERITSSVLRRLVTMNTLSSNTPQDKPHYVYTLAYPESMGGYVFYIGKGYGHRITEHEQRVRKGTRRQGDNLYKEGVIRKIWDAGEKVVRTKLAYFAINDEALEYEAALIIFMRVYEHLTNLSDGGEGTHRQSLSDEAREKLSKSSTNRFHSEATRKRMSDAAKERGFSEAHRNKITVSLMGKTASEVTRCKISDFQKERCGTEEHRQWARDLMNKRAESEEYRCKQSEN